MPVVVTGADEPLGALVIDRLAPTGIELRATVDDREAVAPLVARGVKTAVSDLVDTERFGAVLEGVHTVLHLRGAGDGTLGGRCLAGVSDVVAALPESGVRRVVTLAPPTGGEGELATLEAADIDTVVLLTGLVVGGSGAARNAAPIHTEDLVSALAAADHLRELHGHVRVWAVGSAVVRGPRWRRSGPDLVGDRGAGLREVLGITVRGAHSGR